LNIEHRKKPSNLETGLSIFILLFLGGTGATVFALQFRHNPANDSLRLYIAGLKTPTPDRSSQGINLDLPTPNNLVPSGPVEVFTTENLSDKINGKAEFYLSSGVKRLATRRFRLENAPDAWIEVFLYDMGKPRNGFAVYSGQRREDGLALSLAPFSYRTENAHYFLNGHTYVEIIGSGSTQEEIAAREALAQAIIGANPGSEDAFDELRLFPDPHLDKHSISLISTNAFGFEGLDNVFTALYDVDGIKVMVFLSLRESSSQAKARASAYHAFLLRNGGKSVPPKAFSPEMAQIVEILDTYELIIAKGPILAGVRDAPDQATAERLGRLLMDRLVEAQRPGEPAQ
jgi:hypothetical protein